jgi:hypothetical protein
VSTPNDSPGASAGSFAEESARLMGAFREWAARGQAAVNDVAAHGGSTEAGHSAECTYCPVCQGMALLRGAKPEVVEHLADAFTSLAAAVSAFLPSEAQATERRTGDKVEHIDVTGDERPATGS